MNRIVVFFLKICIFWGYTSKRWVDELLPVAIRKRRLKMNSTFIMFFPNVISLNWGWMDYLMNDPTLEQKKKIRNKNLILALPWTGEDLKCSLWKESSGWYTIEFNLRSGKHIGICCKGTPTLADQAKQRSHTKLQFIKDFNERLSAIHQLHALGLIRGDPTVGKIFFHLYSWRIVQVEGGEFHKFKRFYDPETAWSEISTLASSFLRSFLTCMVLMSLLYYSHLWANCCIGSGSWCMRHTGA